MKTTVICSSWLSGYGHRLDTKPYVGGALETKVFLEQLPLTKELVRDLVLPDFGGIYFAGRESVTWVDSSEYGIPFLRGKDIQLADLSESPWISKRQVELNPTFLIRKGMTLITRSGTIGKTAYVRAEMDGMATSDPLRVVPDPQKIPPGYLYAYLSSKFGVPLLASGAYGAIIQHLEPSDIASIPVPRLGDALEHEIHELIEQAAELRAEGHKLIVENCAELVSFLRFPPLRKGFVWNCGWSVVSSANLNLRLEGHYHSAVAKEVEDLIRGCHCGFKTIREVAARFFKPPMFKRLRVDDETQGRQFVSGIDAYGFRSSDVRYVSNITPNFGEFILQRGSVIFQAAGSIYGLFGRALFVRGWLEDKFCADDMYRIVPQSEEDGAYIFTFLRTPYGRTLIQRASAGHAIPRVWDPQMSQLILPWPEPHERNRFANLVFRAHDIVEEARQKEDEAIARVERSLDTATRS
ncbi:MAG: hypothetical protein FJ147_16135 [Deltaproteobacteria bacterium]|nr:hypothetical protein [Deltaproteobacteria bacterium]